jgi:hypothetical protein
MRIVRTAVVVVGMDLVVLMNVLEHNKKHRRDSIVFWIIVALVTFALYIIDLIKQIAE